MRYSALLPAFAVILALFLSAGCTAPDQPAPAAPAYTTDDLTSFVHSAAEYARENGRDEALPLFSDPEGSFTRGDLYIYAYDFDGVCIAHPYQPEKIGVCRMNETDPSGRYFIKGLVDTAKKGSGFYLFEFPNPDQDMKWNEKLGYVEKVDEDWWLGSGLYIGDLAVGGDE